MSEFKTNIRHKFYGLLCVTLLALVSNILIQLPWLASSGISSLVMAIVLGIIVGNSWHHPASWSPGIQFAAKRLLRLAIILYGFRVNFQQIAFVGTDAFLIDIFVVTFTLLVGYGVGRKILKLDHDLSLLISAGAAICGAAAVLAVEDILKSEPYKAAIAIGTVVLFGTTSMFLFPALQHAGLFGFTNSQFGLFSGASIHEVAQVIVAGTNVSSESGKIAVIVKMIRVLLLVPVLFLISMLNNRISKKAHSHKPKLVIPWFAVGFVLVIAFNSLQLVPEYLVNRINQIDTILLTMAMGAIGIETKLNKLTKVGIKPLYLATLLFIWLFGSVFLLVKLV